jgi:chromosome partitioning protein
MPDSPDLVLVVSLPAGDPEGTIIDAIDTAVAQTPFVVVDLEGTASMAVAYAISRSDLVLVPMQGSQLDAAQAARALRLVAQQEKAFRRSIPHAVIITRTSAAIQPRNLRHLQEELHRNGVTVVETQLHEREAFKAMFAFGGTLHTLGASQVSGLDGARQNAASFVSEVVNLLRAARKGAA